MNFEAAIFIACCWGFGLLFVKLISQKEKIETLEMKDLSSRVSDYYKEREYEWYSNFFKSTPDQIIRLKKTLHHEGYFSGEFNPNMDQLVKDAVLNWAKNEKDYWNNPNDIERYIAEIYLKKDYYTKKDLKQFTYDEEALIKKFGNENWQKYKKYRSSFY